MSLQVWLPLNGDLHNQGLSNIVISNNGASINTSGKIGSCYSFNGSNSYIRSNSTCLSNNDTEWSYTCWFYPTNAHNGCLFSNRTSTDSRGIAIFYYTSKFLIDDGTRWEFTPSVAISVGAWNHLAIVRKAGSYKKFYLNGQLINSTTTTGTPTLANSSWFSIGTSQNSATTATTNPLNGRLNDVRIYNHALSDKEVEEISKGLALHIKLNNVNFSSDSSGYNHQLIWANASNTTDTARYDKSTTLTGSSSYVKVTDNTWMAQHAREMTLNVWAKATTWPTSGRIFSCTESGGFNTEAGNSGYWRFPIYVCTNEAQTSYAYKYDSSEIQISALPTSQWVMLTFVYDSTGTKTYINGVLHHTYTNASYGIRFNTNARLFLGCEASTANPASPYFNGQLSDFRIYYTVLSEEQILELYHTSATIDKNGNVYTRELVEE